MPSPRMDRVQQPVIPIVAALIRERPDTISLGQGLVAYGPPQEATDAALAFAADGDHRYGPVAGEPALVDALARKLATENGIHVETERSLYVTAGGNMAFFHAVLAIADVGDEVVLLSPFYFNHEMAVQMAGAVPVPVSTDARDQPDVEAIGRAITPRTRAVVTISPNNPTGAVYPEATLRAINALCAERGVYHINDEVYEYFTYGEARHFSPGSIPGAAAHTISLFSFSKAYGLASWRVGYMVVPAAVADAVDKIQDTNLICAPLICQRAALGALAAGADYCRRHVAQLADVRALVLRHLREAGDVIDAPPADGAFYTLLRVRTELDAMSLVERLVREHGVAAIPGSAFGVSGECRLRVSYGALEAATVDEGMSRLVRGLHAIVG